MVTIQRSTTVLVQIQKAEDIIKSSGISAACKKCISGPEGGCCQRCANLGPDGCLQKGLACTIWLCYDLRNKFPEEHKQLEAIGNKMPWYIAHGYRQLSLVAEAEMEGNVSLLSKDKSRCLDSSFRFYEGFDK